MELASETWGQGKPSPDVSDGASEADGHSGVGSEGQHLNFAGLAVAVFMAFRSRAAEGYLRMLLILALRGSYSFSSGWPPVLAADGRHL